MEEKIKKLKIGILSFYHPHLGGSGIITSRLAQHLAGQGHEIHFIGYDTDINPKEAEDLGIKLHIVKKIDYPVLKNEPYIWSLASKVCEIDEQVGFDLLHANYALPHAAIAFLAKAKRAQDGKRLPYIVTGHGSDIHTNGAKHEVNPILQLTLNQADGLTFVSKDLKEIAEKELGIAHTGIVIPNFVDSDQFYKKSSDLRKTLDIPENAFVIGHASNFAPIKQVFHFSFLAEFMKSAGTMDNTFFVLVGDGRERAMLEESIEKIGLTKHFRFLGKQNTSGMLEFYNSSDMVLLPSKHEGNPLVILEAMACGVPVVASNVGGIKETVENAGILFELGNIEKLGETIQELKNNKELRLNLAEKGFNKAKNFYSVDFVMREYLNLFQRVAN